MKKLIVIMLLITTSLFLSGCDTPEPTEGEARYSKRKDSGWNACIDQGGIPIMNGWTGGLGRCEFKPE